MSERAEILPDYLHMLGLRMSMRLVAAERINRMKHADGTRYSGKQRRCRVGPSKHALAITMPEEIPRTPSVH